MIPVADLDHWEEINCMLQKIMVACSSQGILYGHWQWRGKKSIKSYYTMQALVYKWSEECFHSVFETCVTTIIIIIICFSFTEKLLSQSRCSKYVKLRMRSQLLQGRVSTKNTNNCQTKYFLDWKSSHNSLLWN